jgi:hypothetical protein
VPSALGVGVVIFSRTLEAVTLSKVIVEGWLDAVAQSTCSPLTGTHRSPSR